MIKILGPVIILLGITNAVTWWQYRVARAEADRAIAECNSDKLEQALGDAELQLRELKAAQDRVTNQLTEMKEREAAVRVTLAEREGELTAQLESARQALREIDVDENSCARVVIDDELWMRYLDATGGGQNRSDGNTSTDVDTDTG